MYEHKKQPLAPKHVYYSRLRSNLYYGTCIIFLFLIIGTVGYHITDGIVWIDAFHNASLILSGMGPVVEIKSTGGKIFSSLYALFSGVAFITTIGILAAPAIHRFFHKLHIEK
jgi:hypothetical protein